MHFFSEITFKDKVEALASESLFGGLVPTSHTRSVFPTPTLTFDERNAPESYLGHASTMALRYTEALTDQSQISALFRLSAVHVLNDTF